MMESQRKPMIADINTKFKWDLREASLDRSFEEIKELLRSTNILDELPLFDSVTKFLNANF